MKLQSSIPANSVKLIDLYNKIVSGSLITGPEYQRKLVWKKQHKFAFIDTILLNFPFPEIYIASADLDLAELKAREVVVDGRQRLTTIVDYIQGNNDFQKQKTVKAFDDLSEQEKRDFLNYLIPVKDLKDIGHDNIIEVFQRINSTNYSLNSNEVLNAQYGGGEFAIFCKLLADREFEPRMNETSITIERNSREFINCFFEKNNVFSNNDVKRMFDSQFIMLICTTILEGQYFSRSLKIDEYLERYNDNFDISNEILGKLLKSLKLIDQLGFSNKSYWFNKANLFSLIVELIKFKTEDLDINSFERKLSELEIKFSLYFVGSEEDLDLISPEEMKFFEVSRQGSHELSARELRGRVVRGILLESLKKSPNTENHTKKALYDDRINFCILVPTATGLTKSIMDATQSVRQFLSSESIHSYDDQSFGPQNKVTINAKFVCRDYVEKDTIISLYRSQGRGDYRIWFSKLPEFADPSDELAIIKKNGLKILNISKNDYTNFIRSEKKV